MSNLKVLSIGSSAINGYLDGELKKVTPHIVGSAANTAKNYKALGHPSKVRLWVGKDIHGKQITENLANLDIITIFEKFTNQRTEHNLVVSDKKNHPFNLIERGAVKTHLKQEDVKMVSTSNWIHLGALNTNPKNINETFEKVFDKKSIPITWSPGPRQIKDGFHPFSDLLGHTVILTLNSQELLQFTNRRSQQRAIEDLLHSGVKILIITNHELVTQVITTTERFTIVPPHGKIKDHHGAGDRWSSTFTSYLMDSYDIPLSMQMATFSTHLLLQEDGADSSLYSKKDLEKKFKKEKKNYLVHTYKKA